MAVVRLTDSSGAELDTIPLVELEKEEELGSVETLARISVNRDDLNSVSGLKPGRSRVFVEDPAGTDSFGGIYRSPGRSGARPLLIGVSFAEYMRRAEPVPLGQKKTGADDDTLINETISATPELSAGTVENLLSGQTYVFSGTTQLRKARTVAEASGGELVFPPDLTVDYVDSRGADKTGTTLSPSNGSFVENTFNVDRDGVSGSTTHLRVYGVGQGSAQIQANIIPAAESDSFTNSATYTNSSWSDGDDEIWDTYTNKDIKNVSALKSWGQNLIGDLQNEEIKVDTIVKGETVNLGDEFHVKHPDEGVDENLRAVKVTKLIAAEGGTKYDVVFSNYSVGRKDNNQEVAKDAGRYNLAFEGDLTRISQSSGRGPVDSTHDYVLDVKYPDDVVDEVGAELYVKGLNYRTYAAGAASHSHDVTHPSHDHDVSGLAMSEKENAAERSTPGSKSISNSSFTDLYTWTRTKRTSSFVVANVSNSSADAETIRYRVEVVEGMTVADTVPDSTGLAVDIPSGDTAIIPLFVDTQGSGSNQDCALQAQSDTGSFSLDVKSVYRIDIDVEQRLTKTSTTALGTDETSTSTAPLADPGIEDWDGSENSPQHYPNNISVDVNGSDASNSLVFDSGSDDGTQAFDATLDMSGELSQGWNTIAISSDGLGHLDATFVADLFRQKL